MPLFKSNKPDEIVRCYCPVCNRYLGTKLDSETRVFKEDWECDYDWIFFPNHVKPKGIKRGHPKDTSCGCGSCGR